jgi:hypothetical protein
MPKVVPGFNRHDQWAPQTCHANEIDVNSLGPPGVLNG